MDPKHLVLGSDTPFPVGEPDPVGFIMRSFPVAPELTAMILRRSAINFLGGK